MTWLLWVLKLYMYKLLCFCHLLTVSRSLWSLRTIQLQLLTKTLWKAAESSFHTVWCVCSYTNITGWLRISSWLVSFQYVGFFFKSDTCSGCYSNWNAFFVIMYWKFKLASKVTVVKVGLLSIPQLHTHKHIGMTSLWHVSFPWLTFCVLIANIFFCNNKE